MKIICIGRNYINHVNSEGYTAFMVACAYYNEYKFIDVINFLIDKGCDINKTEEENRIDAFYVSCKFSMNDDNIDLIKLLIDKGVNINKKYGACYGLFETFKPNNNINITKLLFDYGYKISSRDIDYYIKNEELINNYININIDLYDKENLKEIYKDIRSGYFKNHLTYKIINIYDKIDILYIDGNLCKEDYDFIINLNNKNMTKRVN